MATPRFSASDLERVKAAVAKAESATSGEIVPVILHTSQDYSWLPAVTAIRTGMITFLFVEVVGHFTWPLSWGNTFAIVGLVMSVAAGLSYIPHIARFMLGRTRLRTGVHDRARVLFMREGVTETIDRTGVLVLISRFERQITILGDRGIHSKVKQEFWDSLCQGFVEAVGEKQEVDGLCRLIEKVGAELKRHFPASANDKNELSDDLREDES